MHKLKKNIGPIRSALTVCLFVLSLLVSLPSKAQEKPSKEEKKDVLRLEDGSVIKGNVLGFKNDTLRIELTGGKVLKFARSRVKSIEFASEEEEGKKEKSKGRKPKERDSTSKKEGSQKKGADYYKPGADPEKMKKREDPWPYHRKGYQHHLAQGWFINSGDARTNLSFLLNPQAYSIHTYNASPYFNAGIYAGLQVISGGLRTSGLYNSIGLIVNGDFVQNSPVTPFYDIQAGLSHSIFGLPNGPSGFFGNFGGGVKLFFGNSKGVSLFYGLQMYRLRSRYQTRRGQRITRKETLLGGGIRLTFHL